MENNKNLQKGRRKRKHHTGNPYSKRKKVTDQQSKLQSASSKKISSNETISENGESFSVNIIIIDFHILQDIIKSCCMLQNMQIAQQIWKDTY